MTRFTNRHIIISTLALGLALFGCGANQGQDESTTPPPPPPNTAEAQAAAETPPPEAGGETKVVPVPAVTEGLQLPEGACGGFEKLALTDDTIDLIHGRLEIGALEGGAAIPRAYNIMSAPPPELEETRVFLERGPHKFVVWVREIFRTSGSDLVSFVEQGRGELGSVSPIPMNKGLRGVAFVPSELDDSSEAVLVLDLFIVNTDDTVQMASFFVNPPAMGPGCSAVAYKVARTLAPGSRRLALDGGVTKLPDANRSITLPPRYVMVPQPGPDFTVYRFYKLSGIEEPQANLGVYVGHHPGRHARDGAEVTKAPGQLLGKAVEWSAWSTPAKGPEQPAIHRRELLHELGGGLWTHIFLGAEEPSVVDELVTIAQSLSD